MLKHRTLCSRSILRASHWRSSGRRLLVRSCPTPSALPFRECSCPSVIIGDPPFRGAFTGERRCATSTEDTAIPGAPGYGVPDGFLQNDDFFYYLTLFATGC